MERWSEDYKWNLEPEFKRRLQAFIAANPYGMELLSGYRDEAHQADLVERAKAKHGENWRKWAAPPGKSNHNHGLAGDIHYHSDKAQAWAHENAHRFGLEFPMGHEPWHVEPIGVRSGTYASDPRYGGLSEQDFLDMYTVPPTGFAHAAQQRGDLDHSLALLDQLITGPLPPELAAADDPVLDPIGSPATEGMAAVSGPTGDLNVAEMAGGTYTIDPESGDTVAVGAEAAGEQTPSEQQATEEGSDGDQY